MMARGHATLGALGGAVIAYFPLHLDPVNSVVFMLSTAGFALVPDLDEPKSTISRQFGPISYRLSIFTRRLAGGHRKATHAWPAMIIMLALGFLSMAYSVLGGLLLATSFVLGLRTIMPNYISLMQAKVLPGALVVGMICGSANILDPKVLLFSPALGILLHAIGDWPTPQGIPWLWPKKRNYSLNWFPADSVIEHGVVIPLMLFLTAVTLVVTVVPQAAIWAQESGGDWFSFLDNYPAIINL